AEALFWFYISDDEKKTSHLKDLQSLGPLKIFRVDLNEEGSFDEAITGCVFVFLVAAPVVVDSENLEEDITETNVRGTLNVMGSCVRARATVKRVVLTSSVAAVLHDGRTTMQGGDDGHVVVDESSWSDLDYLATLPNHPSANWVWKVRSEKEASRVARENGISLVTVLPVIVVGAAPATRGFNSSSLVLSLLAGDDGDAEGHPGSRRRHDAAGPPPRRLPRAGVPRREGRGGGGGGREIPLLRRQHHRGAARRLPRREVPAVQCENRWVWRRCRGAKDVDLVGEAGRGRVRVRGQEPGRHVRRCCRVRQGVGDAAISRSDDTVAD
ncbi:Os10g0477900, partial [Oryza sativa Japonica Group]